MDSDEMKEFLESIKNLTEPEFLEELLGPKYLPLSLVIPVTLAYVLIFISGIFGNVATCIVIAKNSYMHNATNCYLFSLAISDLTLLILGLPYELSNVWQQYPWTLGLVPCKTRAYASEMSSYVSVLTIVAFSTERYLAICHPLKLNAISGSKRSIRIILALWIVAMISALPFAIYMNITFIEYPPGSGNYSAESAICSMVLSLLPDFPLYELSCIIFFLLPLIVLLFLYVQMSLKIRQSIEESLGADFFNPSMQTESATIRSRRTVIRMLSAVVIMFFVCWAPFHAQRLFYVYAQDDYPDVNECLFILSGCLYYVSTTVNPILYNLFSSRYREAFKRILCFGKRKSQLEDKGLERNSTKVSHYQNSLRYTFEKQRATLNLNKKPELFDGNRERENSSFGVENWASEEKDTIEESKALKMSAVN